MYPEGWRRWFSHSPLDTMILLSIAATVLALAIVGIALGWSLEIRKGLQGGALGMMIFVIIGMRKRV